MTVTELIKELEKMPGDSPVIVSVDKNGTHDLNDISEVMALSEQFHNSGLKPVCLFYDVLSCGMIHRAEWVLTKIDNANQTNR